MKSPRSACPGCGGLSLFTLKQRVIGEQLEQFIKCSSCPYEKVVRSGPRKEIELEIDIEGLEAKLAKGVPVQEVLAARRRRLEQLREANASSG